LNSQKDDKINEPSSEVVQADNRDAQKSHVEKRKKEATSLEDFLKNAPLPVQEFFKSVPPGVQSSLMMQITRMGLSGPTHPLFDKFTPEHIDKFLDYSHKDDENNFTLTKSGRNYTLIYVAMFLAAFIFLITYLLPYNKDLLVDIIRILVIFAGGFGAGYGFKSQAGKKKP
jgi:hypothetical protein